MSMEALTSPSSLAPLCSTFFLSLHPPSPCVACCETDGEGKDDRQTEGGREREAENDKVGKWGNRNQKVRDEEAER